MFYLALPSDKNFNICRTDDIPISISFFSFITFSTFGSSFIPAKHLRFCRIFVVLLFGACLQAKHLELTFSPKPYIAVVALLRLSNRLNGKKYYDIDIDKFSIVFMSDTLCKY